MKTVPKPKKKKRYPRIRRDPLDALVSEFTRKRAIKRVGGCERCEAKKHDIQQDNGKVLPAWKQLQCSHYHKRRKQSTRYDEDNCVGLCYGCHQHFEEERDEYKAWMINLLGEREFDLLSARMRIIGKPDTEGLKLYYKERIKGLENENL